MIVRGERDDVGISSQFLSVLILGGPFCWPVFPRWLLTLPISHTQPPVWLASANKSYVLEVGFVYHNVRIVVMGSIMLVLEAWFYGVWSVHVWENGEFYFNCSRLWNWWTRHGLCSARGGTLANKWKKTPCHRPPGILNKPEGPFQI